MCTASILTGVAGHAARRRPPASRVQAPTPSGAAAAAAAVPIIESGTKRRCQGRSSPSLAGSSGCKSGNHCLRVNGGYWAVSDPFLERDAPARSASTRRATSLDEGDRPAAQFALEEPARFVAAHVVRTRVVRCAQDQLQLERRRAITDAVTILGVLGTELGDVPNVTAGLC